MDVICVHVITRCVNFDKYFFSIIKDRFLAEEVRDKYIENKSHRFIILTTIIFPIAQFINLDYSFLLIFPTIGMLLLFLGLTRVKKFKFPTDPIYYFSMDGSFNAKVEEDIKKSSKEIEELHIQSLLRCILNNNQITERKIKYLKIIEYLTMAQISILVIVTLISN